MTSICSNCRQIGHLTFSCPDIIFSGDVVKHEGEPSDGGSGYSYSYTGSICYCQGTDCSRILSDGQAYCNSCQEKRDLIRRVENRTSISNVKDAEEFSTW